MTSLVVALVSSMCVCVVTGIVQQDNPIVPHTHTQPCNCSSARFLYGSVLGSRHAYRRVYAASAVSCCQMCAADVEHCVAFNYEPDDGLGCFFQADALPCEARNCTKPAAISSAIQQTPAPAPSGTVLVSIGDVYHHTDPLFKCWNVDPSENREWEARNLSRAAPGMARFYALAKASLPGYLRFGGGGADSFAYQIPGGPPPYLNCTGIARTGSSSADRMHLREGLAKQPPHCLNSTWLLNFLDFADEVGAHLIFGLDINARDETTGRWNPEPARSLIQYATAHNYKFAGFELGNEQQNRFNASMAAADFLVLQRLLVDLFPDKALRPMLVGPDVSGFKPGHFSQERSQYLLDFATECHRLGVQLGALTHHEYIEVDQNQPSATPFSSTKLDETAAIAAVVNATLSRAGVPIWAGEIGPHNGGSPPCDHTSERWARFADSFWYLDAMATKAKYGYSTFCRQDFVGIDYGMLDCATYEPLPDYYSGVLWSRLMGTGVVHVVATDPSATIRAYGHCHPTSPDDMTLLLLNLEPGDGTSRLHLVKVDTSTAEVDAASVATEEYHLTAGSSPAQVHLNGQLLQATETGELPAMVGVPGSTNAIRMAPASIAFIVMKGAGTARCQRP